MPVILHYGLRLDIHRLTKQALQIGDCWRGTWSWSRDGKMARFDADELLARWRARRAASLGAR